MRIAVIGAGNVGGGLGASLAAAGHEIVYGVRDPNSDRTRAAVAATPGAGAAAPASAVGGAEVVIFALRWDAVPDVASVFPSLDGRVVIDAMNRFSGDPGRSTAEDLAQLLPGARVVKTFNTIGYENFTTARDRNIPVSMFICGDDAEAKDVAARLASDLGFEPEDVGPLTNAKALEQMVKVWLALTERHGRKIGFALSRT